MLAHRRKSRQLVQDFSAVLDSAPELMNKQAMISTHIFIVTFDPSRLWLAGQTVDGFHSESVQWF
jgi:hypothetical protein